MQTVQFVVLLEQTKTSQKTKQSPRQFSIKNRHKCPELKISHTEKSSRKNTGTYTSMRAGLTWQSTQAKTTRQRTKKTGV